MLVVHFHGYLVLRGEREDEKRGRGRGGRREMQVLPTDYEGVICYCFPRKGLQKIPNLDYAAAGFHMNKTELILKDFCMIRDIQINHYKSSEREMQVLPMAYEEEVNCLCCCCYCFFPLQAYIKHQNKLLKRQTHQGFVAF